MPDGKKLRQDTLFVTSLEKGMLVLEAFSEDRSELGLSDIVKVTGLEKSAAQRYANTLHELGYLEKNAETRRFKPSVKYLEMAYSNLWSDYMLSACPTIGRTLVHRQLVDVFRPLSHHPGGSY